MSRPMIDVEQVRLCLLQKQKNHGWVNDNNLHKELKDKLIISTKFPDFYLKNPHLIPKDWKGRVAFFWGTIHHSAVGILCVRYLFWCSSSWNWSYNWIEDCKDEDELTRFWCVEGSARF